MAAALALALVALLVSPTRAELKFVAADGSLSDTFPQTPVLLMHGDEAATVTVLYRGEKPASAEVKPVADSDRSIWHTGQITSNAVVSHQVQNKNQWTNYSVPFSFDQGVGRAQWSFVVHFADGSQESVSGEFIVAGLVVTQSGNIVSGDNRQGISIPSYETFLSSQQDLNLVVQACGVQGTSDVDFSSVEFSAMDVMTGTDLKQLASADIAPSGKLNLVLAKYRVGSGKFIINIDVPGIELDGEIYETVLNIKMDTAAVPPPVVVPQSASCTGGYLSVPMYNLLKPPASKNAQSCTLTIGGNAIPFDRAMSKLVQPDQTIVFKTDGHTGSASVACDGTNAVVLGGFSNNTFGVSSNGAILLPNGSSVGLASSFLQPPLADKDGMIRLDTQIRVVSGDPKTYSIESASKILEAVCYFTDGTSCELVNVTKGSAILDINNHVNAATADANRESLDHSIRSCSFQQHVGVPCDDIELNKSVEVHAAESKTKDAASANGRSGTPSAVPIIAGLIGGLCLILVVVGSLWLVHRRNNERTESSISSAGPVGVPDPDNVLYQQAIVRDIYGRGDFSTGGPTPEAIALRRRESELRDSSLRPSSVVSSLRPPPSADDSSSLSV
jgi:hypothetical protein